MGTLSWGDTINMFIPPSSSYGCEGPTTAESVLMYLCSFPIAVCSCLHRLQLVLIQPSLSNPSSFVETDFLVSKSRTAGFIWRNLHIAYRELPSSNWNCLPSTLLSPFLPTYPPLPSLFFYFTSPPSTHSLVSLLCALWCINASRQPSSFPPPCPCTFSPKSLGCKMSPDLM